LGVGASLAALGGASSEPRTPHPELASSANTVVAVKTQSGRRLRIRLLNPVQRWHSRITPLQHGQT
jgi:hypothetical protein